MPESLSNDLPATIRLTKEGFVATIELHRPAKLNALDPEMLDGLEAAAQALERDPTIRVVLLTSASPKAFCVGADINAWAGLSPQEMGQRWIPHGHRVFNRLARLPMPVIACLNGYTFGGGLELALTADIRLAAKSATLAFPEVKIATLPGWGGTGRLPALIGPARAKQMIFTGTPIEATLAARWGLVNEVHPAKALLERAQAMAAAIAANAPFAVQLAKQAIDAATAPGPTAALEALAGTLAASTADAHEGIAAFQERRPPLYEGR